MAHRLESTPQQNALLRQFASRNYRQAMTAQAEVAHAMEAVLRKGIFSGDILGNIFEPIPLVNNNSSAEFPLDFIAPGQEKDFVAYTIPNHGTLPQRHVEGDYVMVPTYEVGATVDYNLKYARDARWDVLSRAQDVMQKQFVKKMNDDGWQTLISAAVDRNIVVVDSDASTGQFTKRLVSLMQTVVRRNGGGNSTSTNRGILTDLYVSPEAMEDILNWGLDQIDETTRARIFNNAGGLSNIYGVNLHTLDELGEGQEYELFYESDLAASLPSVTGTNAHTKTEIVVGLDLTNRDSFVMPVSNPVEIFEDRALHRSRQFGFYGWAGVGFACLDNRRVVLGAL